MGEGDGDGEVKVEARGRGGDDGCGGRGDIDDGSTCVWLDSRPTSPCRRELSDRVVVAGR